MNEAVKLIQPYFVIHTDHYYKAVCARYGISHFYMYTVGETDGIAAVPDGCIDLVFEYGRNRMNVQVCGTVFQYQKTLFQYGHTYFGVRFLPGIRPCLLNVPIKELAGQETDFRLVTNCREFLDKMEVQTCFDDRVRTFLEEYAKIFEKRNLTSPSCAHVLVDHSLDVIYRAGGGVQVQELERESGYSTRYINKVFNDTLGYGPKTFCKIVQFQRLLCRMNALQSRSDAVHERLTDMAVDFGYYDQPQLIRDFKKFANMTPKSYEKLIFKKKYSQHLIEQRV